MTSARKTSCWSRWREPGASDGVGTGQEETAEAAASRAQGGETSPPTIKAREFTQEPAPGQGNRG